MKKYLLLVLIAVLLTVAQMQAASAAQSDGYMHSNHFYAVSFDGEGDAIVRAQIGIENTLDRAISSVDLEIPGQAVIYKAVQQPAGAYAPPYYAYGSPDYYPQQNQYGHAIEYSKTLTSEATILHIDLWAPVQRGESTTMVLFYKIPLYAKKDALGNYQFDFKTIIDNDAILIQNMRVAVNAQEGYSLRGGESKVDYRQNSGFIGEAMMAKAASADITSQEYRQYYYDIQNAQGLVKTSSNLDAFESFHVKGTYGENSFIVNFPESVLAPLAALLILGILAAVGKAIALGMKGKAKFDTSSWPGIGFISFGSAAAILAINATAFFAANWVNGISYSLEWLSILAVLGGALVSLGMLFILPLYVSSKHGMAKGAAVFFLTIGFLLILAVALGLLLTLIFPPVIYYANQGIVAMD